MRENRREKKKNEIVNASDLFVKGLWAKSKITANYNGWIVLTEERKNK